ncbi:D-alanine--D-alanine ligase [Amycolatopsis sp. cmx-4-83]|uniref:D-alanine--D-alanine ligase family protein n=1 Tax=Amycolatopsis sp. cmx-4-83 TaxID=2790940 RepID=UPI003978C8A8
MAPLRVLHVAGSPTSDLYAELSRVYAEDCLLATADETRYEFYTAYVTTERRWRFPESFGRAAVDAAPSVTLSEAVGLIADLKIDVAVPQMFCVPGMTAYRALLELLGLPYIGNRPEVMAATAHKPTARALVAAAGVRVPAGEVIGAGQTPRMPPPVVVKPADADNSLGMSLVRARSQYPAAVAAALERSDTALVEAYVAPGREVRCGVLERNGGLVCLPLEEYAVDPVNRPVRAAADKLGSGDGGSISLAAKKAGTSWIVDRADPITAETWAVARRCYTALGCRHYGLFDFRIDPAGTVWFLEAGLYSSFARMSVVTTMAQAAGIPLRELFADSVDLAIRQSRS